MARPKKVLILTDGDADGICAAAIAKASYPEAKVEFTTPQDLVSKLDSLSGYDRVIILDLGINHVRKAEAITAVQDLHHCLHRPPHPPPRSD
jgi:single-stranded DNA-specific DHH superfamily exonuclease